MKCPFCGSSDTQVIDSRVLEESNSIRRRRRCIICDKRFNTFETAELRLPNVIKTTGERTTFDENKLRTSMYRALHKRPVATEAVDLAIDCIKQDILQSGEREISSRTIGEKVMNQLMILDQVAYIRFASVYYSFADIEEFKKITEKLYNKGKK